MLNSTQARFVSPSRKGRRLALVAAMTAVVTGATACGGEDSSDSGPGTAAPAGSSWEDVEAAASTEGTVVAWGAAVQPQWEAVERAFEAAYPDIDLQWTRYSASELVTRVDAEATGGTSTVDVLLNTDRVWHAQRHQQGDLFAELIGPDVQAAEDAIPNAAEVSDASAAPSPGAGGGASGAPDASQVLYDDDTRALVFAGLYGFGWNTEAVPDGVSDQEDLWENSDYRGKFGLVDPAVSPVQAALYATMREEYPDLFEDWAAQEPRIYPTVDPLAAALAAGEVDVAAQMGRPNVADRPNLEMAYPDPILGIPVYGAVINAAPHANAAQVFLNWLESEEGQAAIAKGYGSVLPDVEGTDASLQDVQLFDAASFDQQTLQDTVADFNEAMGR